MEEQLQELKQLLTDMDISVNRIALLDIDNIDLNWNLRWLNRNVAIRNGNHPNINEALTLIKSLMISKK